MGRFIFGVSAAVYAFFWVWAIWHSWETPKAPVMRRALWVVAHILNPFTATWYWYIWKRWVFLALFTPLVGVFLSFPFVVRSLLSHAEARVVTDVLFALGSARLLVFLSVLMIFPIVIRFAALLHLGKNTEMNAMDRNDWIISFALPVFGFGAAFAYCVRHLRSWAIAGLCWFTVFSCMEWLLLRNVLRALMPYGSELRLEVRSERQK